MVYSNHGIITKRSSGWYPTEEYKDSDLVLSCKGETAGYVYNYVRYTPKCEQYVMHILNDMGYTFIDG